MFERTGGYYLPLSIGATVVFARGVARLADDFLQQAPTAVFAVPRIFERFAARIERSLADSGMVIVADFLATRAKLWAALCLRNSR